MFPNPNNGCTCMRPWLCVLPPPPCPVHSPQQHCCGDCQCHIGIRHFYTTTTNTVTINSAEPPK